MATPGPLPGPHPPMSYNPEVYGKLRDQMFRVSEGQGSRDDDIFKVVPNAPPVTQVSQIMSDSQFQAQLNDSERQLWEPPSEIYDDIGPGRTISIHLESSYDCLCQFIIGYMPAKVFSVALEQQLSWVFPFANRWFGRYDQWLLKGQPGTRLVGEHWYCIRKMMLKGGGQSRHGCRGLGCIINTNSEKQDELDRDKESLMVSEQVVLMMLLLQLLDLEEGGAHQQGDVWPSPLRATVINIYWPTGRVRVYGARLNLRSLRCEAACYEQFEVVQGGDDDEQTSAPLARRVNRENWYKILGWATFRLSDDADIDDMAFGRRAAMKGPPGLIGDAATSTGTAAKSTTKSKTSGPSTKGTGDGDKSAKKTGTSVVDQIETTAKVEIAKAKEAKTMMNALPDRIKTLPSALKDATGRKVKSLRRKASKMWHSDPTAVEQEAPSGDQTAVEEETHSRDPTIAAEESPFGDRTITGKELLSGDPATAKETARYGDPAPFERKRSLFTEEMTHAKQASVYDEEYSDGEEPAFPAPSDLDWRSLRLWTGETSSVVSKRASIVSGTESAKTLTPNARAPKAATDGNEGLTGKGLTPNVTFQDLTSEARAPKTATG